RCSAGDSWALRHGGFRLAKSSDCEKRDGGGPSEHSAGGRIRSVRILSIRPNRPCDDHAEVGLGLEKLPDGDLIGASCGAKAQTAG
ncbi:MAG: hypothetical protein NTZ29_11955, partial [Verrucomicrobia bacterium]|nr:hypothetical protein [Verrucomicrobiota bacterium]